MNTYGKGWKKHGKDGRFMKKRDLADMIISLLLGLIIVMLVSILVMRRMM